MNNFNRKVKFSLIIVLLVLIVFICLSKTGMLFSINDSDIITVTTTKKTFEPNKYMASVINLKKEETITETTTIKKVDNTTTKIVTKTVTTTTQTTTTTSSWDGPVLTKSKGVVIGPSGKETYYNLNMSGVVKIMRNLGFSEEEYPYWVRDDGVKMLGNYVMVAASFNIRPRGSLVESSLGTAIVCDTGGFAQNNPTQLDIAVTW